MMEPPPHNPGLVYLGDGSARCEVWAPRAQEVVLHLDGGRTIPLESTGRGWHAARVTGVAPGTRYQVQLGAGQPLRPDPASRLQPSGVHAASELVDPHFAWDDGAWRGVRLPDLVLYELHVGTFTHEGTFDAVIPHLPGLRELGITAIELMPLAQFPGTRNWGYDGACPFAVQSSYGGPAGLKRLVAACHRAGLAVVLDVVYNHLGPEGNYLAEFGPFFTDQYRVPWGQALNFDGPDSDEVRSWFLANAFYWIEELHVDGLRLDAVQAIMDWTAWPFLEQLASAVHARAQELGRPVHLIAESDRNDPRCVLPPDQGGVGFDAVWSDDFHHAFHALLTGERNGYYADFGSVADLATAFRESYVYSGQRSAFRGRCHGRPVGDAEPHRFVMYAQNHDQVGNRMRGERLASLVPVPALGLAAFGVLLAPGLPLLFMGEEWGETAPFLYFTSHSDPDLVAAVLAGRRAEFAAFQGAGEPPDPQSEASFRACVLAPGAPRSGHQLGLRELYRELLRLRRTVPVLARSCRGAVETQADEPQRTLLVHRHAPGSAAVLLLRFLDQEGGIRFAIPAGRWRKVLDSADPRWSGGGSRLPDSLPGGTFSLSMAPFQAALYLRDESH